MGFHCFFTNIIIYIFVIICVLIYTEIIVLHFWKLDQNIHNEIYYRAIKEYNEEKDDLNEFCKRNKEIIL